MIFSNVRNLTVARAVTHHHKRHNFAINHTACCWCCLEWWWCFFSKNVIARVRRQYLSTLSLACDSHIKHSHITVQYIVLAQCVVQLFIFMYPPSCIQLASYMAWTWQHLLKSIWSQFSLLRQGRAFLELFSGPLWLYFYRRIAWQFDVAFFSLVEETLLLRHICLS